MVGIDAREDIAALHLLPFAELDREQPPVDLRPDRHGVERLDGADRVERHGHIGGARGSDKHRDDPVPALAATAAILGRRGCRFAVGDTRDQSAKLVPAQANLLLQPIESGHVPQRRPEPCGSPNPQGGQNERQARTFFHNEYHLWSAGADTSLPCASWRCMGGAGIRDRNPRPYRSGVKSGSAGSDNFAMKASAFAHEDEITSAWWQGR